MDEVMTSGMAYSYTLLNKWEEILLLFREYETAKNTFLIHGVRLPTAETAPSQLVTSMFILWEELYPKVKEMDNFPPTLRMKFLSFEPYRNSTHYLITNPQTGNEIYELKDILRNTLEYIDVTYFPKARK
jgi:hypothetical protein